MTLSVAYSETRGQCVSKTLFLPTLSHKKTSFCLNSYNVTHGIL